MLLVGLCPVGAENYQTHSQEYRGSDGGFEHN